MAKRRYSVEARAAYHRARVDSRNISANKKFYSRNWLDGFTDKHPYENYQAVCSEISRKKKNASRNVRISLYGYRNGLKAQLDKK